MKYLLLIVSCLIATSHGLPAEVIEMIREVLIVVSGECKTAVGATDEDIVNIKEHHPPTTHTGKCFLACMHKKFGFQDSSGKIDRAGTYAALEKMKPFDEDYYVKMKGVADHCLDKLTDNSDECETALDMMVCIQHEKKEAGIPPLDL